MTINHTLTKYDIEEEAYYWDNPDNKYHHIYQTAVNRRFSLAIHVFVLTWIVVLYGWQPALAFVLGYLGICALLLFISKVVIPLTLDIFEMFLAWLYGY